MNPRWVKEDWEFLNLGPDQDDVRDEDDDDNTDEVSQPPKEVNIRSPPFEIQYDFNKYRSGKVYKSE